VRVLILGGDGYLGWPTAMRFAARGHEVLAVDNYLRRRIAMETRSEALVHLPNLNERAALFERAAGRRIEVEIADGADYRALERIVAGFRPDTAIHYAEQPSAPYSMIGFDEARLTLNNNLNTTFNLIWAVAAHAPGCHIIKLGTMGEYGTPDIDIEEGWIEIEKNGRRDTFLYPRQAGSLYHTTKVLDTDLLWFYVRAQNLRVTDLMQGPVYGLSTPEAELDAGLAPHFHYDDIFGTVVNRFLVQAVAGVPLTVYGKGGQTRGFLNLNDTLQCVELAAASPAGRGQLRILNQFTEIFTVIQIAEKIKTAGEAMGLDVSIETIENPRREKEEHYYHAKHSGLLELGLQPTYMTGEVIAGMLERIIAHKARIDPAKIMPRTSWGGQG